MTEKEYKECIAAALCPEYEAMLSEQTSEHEFSESFEKNMKKLIRRRNKPYYKLINTSAKRIAVIGLAFITVSLSTVLSVEALRKPFLDFWISIFSSNSKIEIDSDSEKVYPYTIIDRYEISDGLTGYTEINSFEEQYKISNEYIKDDSIIYFEQITVEKYQSYVNTENAQIEHIDINGFEAIGFMDNNGYYHLIWNNGQYVFDLGSNIGKNALIELAKSVQKVEK